MREGFGQTGPARQRGQRAIVSANLARRNLTKGQQAMAYAMIHPEAQHGGKREKGSSSKIEHQPHKGRLSQARTVLRHSEKLAQAVLKGITSLDEAIGAIKTEESRLTSAEAQLEKLRRSAEKFRLLVEIENHCRHNRQ